MHLLHLGSALLLAIALPTQDSTTGSEVHAPFSSILEIANPMETVVLAGVPKLTPNNTCGDAGNGNNNGYTCDPKRSGGGAPKRKSWSLLTFEGNGPLYCGTGCQPDFGKCDVAMEPGPSNLYRVPSSTSLSQTTPSEPATFSNSVPYPSTLAQPKPKEYNCGLAFGNKKCPDGLCCSDTGYCGNTTDYCKLPDKCQKSFGRCDSNMVPVGIGTSPAPMAACVVSRGKFCGVIPRFEDKTTCFASVGACKKQAENCPTIEGSDVEGCTKFGNICRLESAFCTTCGSNVHRPCQSKYFEYKIE